MTGQQANLGTVNEAAGIFGIFAPGQPVASLTNVALHALEHRGADTFGIAVSDGEAISAIRDAPRSATFGPHSLAGLPGHLAVGATYAQPPNGPVTQPAIRTSRPSGRTIALALNGNLTAHTVEAMSGGPPRTSSELIADAITRTDVAPPPVTLADTVHHTIPDFYGAYSLICADARSLVAVCDPNGFRLINIGKLEHGWVIASETSALQAVGAFFVRLIEPGEQITIDERGLRSSRPFHYDRIQPTPCIRELIHIAGTDSRILGRNLHQLRMNLGEELAEQAPVDADLVIPVPDSGTSAAMGYARATGTPYGIALVSPYSGRSGRQPDSGLRPTPTEYGVVAEAVRDRRIVLVDDWFQFERHRRIVLQLREAGAEEVHLRFISPPVREQCRLGVNGLTWDGVASEGVRISDVVESLDVESVASMRLDYVERVLPQGIAFCTSCLTEEPPDIRPPAPR